MKTMWMLVASVVAAPLGAQESEGPRAVVETLFQAMKEGDADTMASLLHPQARLVTTRSGPDGPGAAVIPVERWLEGVRSSERELDERIHGVEVRVDQGLASVWAQYDLFVDGTLSHCGVDAFHLIRTADGWRILEIVDTRRTEGCASS